VGHIQPQTQTGSVTGFSGGVDTGLLQTLVDFVTSDPGTPGLDWTVEMNQTICDQYGAEYSGSPLIEVILSNTGVSGLETIIVGFREYQYASGNEYNIELNGYLSVPAGWNSHALATHGLNGYDEDRKHWNYLPMLQCFDNEMEYWFYSTQEFISASVRVGTSYYQFYVGNGMRFSSPSEHPYPLVVAGSSVGPYSYQADGNGPVRPGTKEVSNNDYYTAFFINASGIFNTTPTVEPMQGNSNNVSIDRTAGDAAFMCPAFYRDSQATYLQLYNTFVIRVTNLLSESLYTDPDNRQYRVFAQGLTDYDYEFLAMVEDIGLTSSTTSTT